MSTRLFSPSTGRRIVAVGAVALLIFMFFFKWYGGTVSGLPHGAHLTGATLSSTGWQTFTISRWVWLLTILLALGSVFASASGYKDDGSVPLSALVAGLGVLASALIIIRIVHHPGLSASAGAVHISYGVKTGIWLGLIAALAITLGGYVQTQSQTAEPEKQAEPEDPAEAFSGLTVSSVPPATGSSAASPGSGPAPAEGAAASSTARESASPPPDGTGDPAPPSA